MRALTLLEIENTSGAGFIAKTITEQVTQIANITADITNVFVEAFVPNVIIPFTSFNIQSKATSFVKNMFMTAATSLATPLGNFIESSLPILQYWHEDGNIDWHGVLYHFDIY